MGKTRAEVPEPVVSAEAEEFAYRKGAGEYLPKVIALAQRLFPGAPIEVYLYEDPELHDQRSVMIEVQVPFTSDFTEIVPGHNAWAGELFKICPATHVHVFTIHFAPVL